MCFNLVGVVPMPLDLGVAPAPSTKELPPQIAVPGWSGVDRVAVVHEDLLVRRDRPQAYHAHDSAETGVEERSEGGIRGEGVAHFVPWKEILLGTVKIVFERFTECCAVLLQGFISPRDVDESVLVEADGVV